jgi:hypothetical protein
MARTPESTKIGSKRIQDAEVGLCPDRANQFYHPREAEEKVSGVKHALHKWFRSEEAARRYLDESSMTREALWGANSPEDLISSVCDGLERVSLGSTGSNWSDSSNLPDLSELSDSSDLSDSGGASMYTDDLTFKDERKY